MNVALGVVHSTIWLLHCKCTKITKLLSYFLLLLAKAILCKNKSRSHCLPNHDGPFRLEAQQALIFRTMMTFYGKRSQIGHHHQIDAEIETGPTPLLVAVVIEYTATTQARFKERTFITVHWPKKEIRMQWAERSPEERIKLTLTLNRDYCRF